MFSRFKFAAATVCCALLTQQSVQAQAMPQVGGFPSQTIKFVSPFPPGGGNDGTTRIVANRLAEIIGQSVVVDNRGGAGGNIGAKSVADAKADGYTVLTGQVSLMAINPTLYASAGFDPQKNFVPITQINAAPLVIVVSGTSPLKTFADLVAKIQAQPGKVTYATPGNGTLSHLVGVVLEKDSGLAMTHIPYKGSAPATTDLLGGQVDLLITSTAATASFIQSGKMRALAVTSTRRMGVFTKVPTLEELGYRNMTFEDWYGFFAPAGTPPERVAYLNEGIVRTLKLPEVAKAIHDGGSEVVGNTSAAFGSRMAEDIARWSRVVKLSGAKID